MDPVQKLWFFEHWVQTQKDNIELAKNHAYLLGSFSNPEAVKNLLDTNRVELSEEEWDQSSEMVRTGKIPGLANEADKENKPTRRKRKAKGI